MEDITRQLALNGLMIWEESGEFILAKMATSINPSDTFKYKGSDVCRHAYKTYQDAFSAAMIVLGKPQNECEFSVHARYERGLGWETIKLPGVRSLSVSEAKKLAWEQALQYFAEHEDLKDASLSEVRIRPGNLE